MLEDKTKMYLNIENINIWPKRHKGLVLQDNTKRIRIKRTQKTGRKHYFAAEGAQGGGVGGQDVRNPGDLQPEWDRQELFK